MTAVLGEKKEIFEVWGLRDSYSWYTILGDIDSLEDARKYKNSLIKESNFTEDTVLIKRVTWIATAVTVVS